MAETPCSLFSVIYATGTRKEVFGLAGLRRTHNYAPSFIEWLQSPDTSVLLL